MRLEGRLIALCLVLAVSAQAQVIEIYRARHRLAQELVPIAESAMGPEGQVTLDSRTATLILNGSEAAVRRGLAMLAAFDRPLAQIVLRHEIREGSDLKVVSARIRWQASLGPVRIGSLPLAGNELVAGFEGRRETKNVVSRSMVKLLEGSSGLILTGEALPLVFRPYWGTSATTFIPVETGFEATAHVVGEDRVQLELRPFSGRVRPGGALQYTTAATSLMVQSGETILFAETSREISDSQVALDGGRTDEISEQRILLISVEIEKP